jgi:hypothetical protein
MKKLGLRVKLDFRFDTEDMEFPEMDFISDDPVEEKREIKTIKRKKRNKKEIKKLF